MLQRLSSYVPRDRLAALVRGESLPEWAEGAALYADIAGFTPLAEALVGALGVRRGAEELTRYLNQAYDALIAEVDRYGGSVINFAGDAITCWFDAEDEGRRTKDERAVNTAGHSEAVQPHSSFVFRLSSARWRAVACAQAMQQALAGFVQAAGTQVALTVKVAVVAGSVRRVLVGDPAIQLLDALAGSTIDTLATANQLAERGEVLLDALTAEMLATVLTVEAWRSADVNNERFAVVSSQYPVASSEHPVASSEHPVAGNAPGVLSTEYFVLSSEPLALQPWLLPAVYERLHASPEPFLAELRPAVALMLQFGGFAFDSDPSAGARLDAYVRQVQHTVAHYAGAVIDLTLGASGGYVYIAFGAPIAHDDDAVRAVGCALALQKLSREQAEVPEATIGIARGLMRAGPYGSSTRQVYGVLGDATNLAFRIMGRAPVGAIWCDDSVYARAHHHWQFEPVAAMRLKGKAGEAQIYQPTGAAAAGNKAADGALQGRAPQLARLEQALAALVAGAGRVLIVDGEAGIGKSRLVAELGLLARARGLEVLAGAGQSIERQLPYHAWRALFATFFGLADVMPMAEREARVVALLAALLPAQAEAASLLNDLLGLQLPEPPTLRALDAALRSERLASLLRALLAARVAQAPFVIVLEDAHWLDSRSWELALRVARLPLLLLLTMRPLNADQQALREVTALLRLPAAERVSLTTLPADATLAIAAERLGVAAADLPPTLADLLAQRAGGNPLFAQELATALREQGLLRVEGETPMLLGSVEQLAALLPDTLHGLLLARIDALPPTQQITLKMAAVVGPTFAFAPLQHVCSEQHGAAAPTLKEQLRTLAARDLTELEAPEPALAYRFRHILTQEAAYQTMLYAQRRDLHRSVAGWYEGVYAQPAGTGFEDRGALVGRLAYHYRQAEEPAHERRYAHLAGIHAADQYANNEALAHFTRALELTPAEDLAERYALLLARVQIHELSGDYVQQDLDLTALEQLVEQLADDARRAQVAVQRGLYAEQIDDIALALQQVQRAVALSQAVDARTSLAAAYSLWGRLLLLQSEYEQARTQLAAALELARAERLVEVELEAMRQIGRTFLLAGQNAEAQARFEQVLERSREASDEWRAAIALMTLGACRYEAGDYAQSSAYTQEAYTIFRRVGDRRREAGMLNNLALYAQEQGDYDAARAYFEQALALQREVNAPGTEGQVLRNMGGLERDLGQYERARTYYEQSLALYVQSGILGSIGYTQLTLGLLLHELGEQNGAQQLAQAALEVAHNHEESPYPARRALTLIGHCQAARGELADADSAYQQALELPHPGDNDFDLVGPYFGALAGRARLALARGEHAQSLPHIEPVLAYLQTGTLDGAEEPARIYLSCYHALQVNGDPRASALLTQAAMIILARADAISDPELRRSYLERVAAQRELVALYQAQARRADPG